MAEVAAAGRWLLLAVEAAVFQQAGSLACCQLRLAAADQVADLAEAPREVVEAVAAAGSARC